MTVKLIKTAPTAQQDDAVNREATALLQSSNAAPTSWTHILVARAPLNRLIERTEHTAPSPTAD